MLLGANPETIDKAEDRQMFKDTMEAIGQPVIPSKVVNTIDDAAAFRCRRSAILSSSVPLLLWAAAAAASLNDEAELREITEHGLQTVSNHSGSRRKMHRRLERNRI